MHCNIPGRRLQDDDDQSVSEKLPLRDVYTFGNSDEKTTAVVVTYLDSDSYVDVVTLAEHDHVRIYRGTALTNFNADFSEVVPETVDLAFAVESYASGRRLQDEDNRPYSRFPGNANPHAALPSARQLLLADFDANGFTDLFVHSPAPSAGSCAQRCHALGRFGYDSFEMQHAGAAALDESVPTSFCYCGPQYDTMEAPMPPPSPPKPPPLPESPPSVPPIPSPHAPPPSPPLPCADAPRTL
tara:strand:+ start:605 stop:1330 length:726 start_codon:yes stop_codon:yes gene_type:complete